VVEIEPWDTNLHLQGGPRRFIAIPLAKFIERLTSVRALITEMKRDQTAFDV